MHFDAKQVLNDLTGALIAHVNGNQPITGNHIEKAISAISTLNDRLSSATQDANKWNEEYAAADKYITSLLEHIQGCGVVEAQLRAELAAVKARVPRIPEGYCVVPRDDLALIIRTYVRENEEQMLAHRNLSNACGVYKTMTMKFDPGPAAEPKCKRSDCEDGLIPTGEMEPCPDCASPSSIAAHLAANQKPLPPDAAQAVSEFAHEYYITDNEPSTKQVEGGGRCVCGSSVHEICKAFRPHSRYPDLCRTCIHKAACHKGEAMNDRGLLELAAKAFGLSADLEFVEGMGMAYLKADRKHLDQCIWNPLTDDGDALRLAVKLHINIEIWNTENMIRANAYIKDKGHVNTTELYTNDSEAYAVTRRAIVRAAASIGGQKP